MLASHRTSHWQVYTRIMPELPSLASGSAYYGVGSPAGLRYHDKVLIPRSNPSSGSQNLENLNKEFQTSTPKCKRQLRSFARTQHKGGKFSSRTRPQETKPQKQTSRANLLIVILSCVQFWTCWHNSLEPMSGEETQFQVQKLRPSLKGRLNNSKLRWVTNSASY